ncbi:gfo/Idh/MocA family oxidoreductase [Halosegnis rubeus]|uniref:Gfo/Idh/MocA family oxidoreductase n=1 Tax=Halosegnis rubeus TaxID=2212850 RepID=A0A5N5UAG9_9EURY|nr:Gfo/Idh/MocA family oxidoreductase [Halosegnis rubeus]KAB7514662.1 gfo/Idh/MocA family oxidoreductase [Halosegnis rubeus]
MSDQPTRIGVIGVGSMGNHHVRVYDELGGVELVGVADADDEQAAEIAREYDTRALEIPDLVEAVDAVSIAVPTPYHYETAITCLEEGVHVLIEKPIAATKSEGETLIDTAGKNGVHIQVGHIERFNPAVTTLEKILEREDIVAIDAERLGPPPQRAVHDNAIFDLMIHDADIVLSLLNDEPVSVQSAGTRDNKYATATLQFESGVVATLTASRLTQRKVRKLQITTKNNFIELDYLDQTIDIYRRSAPEFVQRDSGMQYRHESVIERPQIDNVEPLKAELREFVESIRTDTTPRVSGHDGLRAFELVTEIDERSGVSDQ